MCIGTQHNGHGAFGKKNRISDGNLCIFDVFENNEIRPHPAALRFHQNKSFTSILPKLFGWFGWWVGSLQTARKIRSNVEVKMPIRREWWGTKWHTIEGNCWYSQTPCVPANIIQPILLHNSKCCMINDVLPVEFRQCLHLYCTYTPSWYECVSTVNAMLHWFFQTEVEGKKWPASHVCFFSAIPCSVFWKKKALIWFGYMIYPKIYLSLWFILYNISMISV